MSTFIKLTAITRNGLPFAKEILVDINKIVVPIVENLNSESILEVDTDVSYNRDFSGNLTKYVVAEDLDAIDLLTTEVFKGTILTYNTRPSIYPAALFVKSKVLDVVEPLAIGSKFSYELMSQKSPDVYTVQESLNTINA